MVTRSAAFDRPGGDTVQLLKTKKYLELEGVTASIWSGEKIRAADWDLVHFFNLRNPQHLLAPIRMAATAGIPAVLSTIWGSYLEGDRATRTGYQSLAVQLLSESFLEYAKSLARTLTNGDFDRSMTAYFAKGHLKSQQEICDSVDVLLPNSPTELERVRADMKAPHKPAVVVHNAVDADIFNPGLQADSARFREYRGSVLCVARIEARKGQLNLIRACKTIGARLVLVGQHSANSRKYYEMCREEADENVIFLGSVPHDQLAPLYRVAQVHALISWMETPGLSSLEAGAMGCNLVVTDRGDTKYYFKDMAEYADPADVSDIARCLQTALGAPLRNDRLSLEVLKNFTWNVAATQTLLGYKTAVGEHGVK